MRSFSHSTDTALVCAVNDLRLSADSQNPSIMVSLDLSAAFDTVDHKTLRHHLAYWVGLSGTVLERFKSYLMYRQFLVSLGNHSLKRFIIFLWSSTGSSFRALVPLSVHITSRRCQQKT